MTQSNIIWFNPRFNKNVSTNAAKQFLNFIFLHAEHVERNKILQQKSDYQKCRRIEAM